MGKLFASLYLYIIVSLVLVSGVIEHIWPYEDNQQQIALNDEFGESLKLLSQTPQGLDNIASRFPSEIISAQDLLLPPKQQSEFDQQSYIYLFDSEQNAIWYLNLNPQEILKVGPLEVTASAFPSVWPYLLILCIVGIPIALWSFMLWRDFEKLRLACEAVGGSQDFELSVPSRSFFLPITDTLRVMQQRIQHLLTAQQELTSSVSHEFRTPLARLKFALVMLEDQVLDEKALNYIDNMQLDINELESLVKEMLDYARLDSEQPNLNIVPVDLVTVIESVVEKLSFVSDISFKTELPATLIYPCDSHFLARSLQNLIGNAVKYANKQVKVSLYSFENEISLHVEDDGPGIDAVDWENIFKPFTRLDKSRDKKTGGFGLGLAIVAKIVSWHQGQYQVKDSSLGGAQFTICLPIQNYKQ